MSHFFTIVLIPPSRSGDVELYLHENLKRYSIYHEVEEYEEECWCVGRKALKDARNRVRDELGSLNDISSQYHLDMEKYLSENPEKRKPETLKELDEWKGPIWQDYLAPLLRREQQLFNTHPDRNKPDPHCRKCQGTGTYMTTENPNNKWDWWCVGGCWNGVVCGKPKNYPQDPHDPRLLVKNTVSVKKLLQSFDPEYPVTPHAILAPDGWHEKPAEFPYGPGDLRSEYKWIEEVKNIYKKFPDHLAIGCDLHN
jgi:hypothetical protein